MSRLCFSQIVNKLHVYSNQFFKTFFPLELVFPMCKALGVWLSQLLERNIDTIEKRQHWLSILSYVTGMKVHNIQTRSLTKKTFSIQTRSFTINTFSISDEVKDYEDLLYIQHAHWLWSPYLYKQDQRLWRLSLYQSL